MRILLVFTLLFNIVFAQFEYDTYVYLDSLRSQYIKDLPRKGTNEFTQPDECEAEFLKDIIYNILQDSITDITLTKASLFSYGIDVKKEVTVFYPKGNKHWGTYVFSNEAKTNAVVQVPHPLNDKHTSQQGMEAFYHYKPLALMLSGTHRYNSDKLTGCSSLSSLSDVAHNHESAFHIITTVIANYYNKSVFVQFHGFKQRKDDPDIIFSNGTKSSKGQVYNNISYFVDDKYFKVDIAFSTTSSKMNGTQNVQGRFLNGSSKPCLIPDSTPTNRFFHIEQALDLRDSRRDRKVAIDFIRFVFL